jgi:integral membrane protein (TIGR01906 family)
LNNINWTKVTHWLLAIGVVLWVGFGLFAASIHPAYPNFEYTRDSFPEDRYGWTDEERRDLALVAVDYLRRPEPAAEIIYLLEEQVKPGTNEPLYNESEIGHMLDVKIVADNFVRRLAGIGFLLVVVCAGILLWQKQTPLLFSGIQRGGMILTLILVGIGLFIGIGWQTFFTLFHELLFPPGTWSFPLDDSLIRLFPDKFWFDYGVITSTVVLIGGAITWALGWFLGKKVG